MRIWKYPLDITDYQFITMPQDATILDAQIQHGQLCLWALVNPENPMSARTILIFGTGHDIAEYDQKDLGYISMFQINDGQLVFHVFEVKP